MNDSQLYWPISRAPEICWRDHGSSSPSYRRGNWVTKRLRNLLKVFQPGNSGSKIYSKLLWPPSPRPWSLRFVCSLTTKVDPVVNRLGHGTPGRTWRREDGLRSQEDAFGIALLAEGLRQSTWTPFSSINHRNLHVPQGGTWWGLREISTQDRSCGCCG